MTQESTEQSTALASKFQSVQVNIMDVIYKGLRNWPWIIASVVICVGLAYFYLLRTPNVYTRTASILIKSESNGKSVGKVKDFGNIGLVQQNTNADIEVNMIQASAMMEEVVRALNLDMNYTVEGRFHDAVLYGPSLPVNVSMFDVPDEKSASLKMSLTPKGVVKMNNFILNGAEVGSGDVKGLVGDTINTPLGKILVSATNTYNPDATYNKINVSKSTIGAATASYKGRLGVALKDKEIPVITLTFVDRSTKRAEDVLNALIAIYNENWIRDKNQIAVSTSNFIDERLAVIEGELGNVDQDISQYKSEHLIPDVQAVQSIDLQQSNEMARAIVNLNNQLEMMRYVRNYITDDVNRNKLLPVSTGVSSSAVSGQITSYNERMLYRNSLAASSSESNPLVLDLDENLSSMRKALISSVDNEILSLNTQLRSLQQSEAKATSRIAANPSQAKYLLSVERQQKIKESLYLFLLQKREENELTQAFTAYNTRIIELPNGSNAPTAPHANRILMMAFALGLFLPFGVIYVLEMSNNKVRGRKDIDGLSLPFLGEIPYSHKKKGLLKKVVEDKKETVIVKAGRRDVPNEAFRVLRTNIEFMCGRDHGSSVIVLTSFNPGSGKSFISVNLATGLAIKGRKVLLIDGDMRHGSTSAIVNRPKQGLSNYLSGSINDIHSVIVTDKTHPTLSILPIGTIPPNPTELLEDGRFGELIKQMREEYEYIIIDCPPIEIVADTQIIEQYADRTIFILRAGLFYRSMLPELEKIYAEKKFKNMSLILNGTYSGDSYGSSYRYGYRYGYGYGYGYGYHYYGNSDEKDE